MVANLRAAEILPIARRRGKKSRRGELSGTKTLIVGRLRRCFVIWPRRASRHVESSTRPNSLFRSAADYASVAQFAVSPCRAKAQWSGRESHPRHADFQSAALLPELPVPTPCLMGVSNLIYASAGDCQFHVILRSYESPAA